MSAELGGIANYSLKFDEQQQSLALNPLLGKTLRFRHTGNIYCGVCGCKSKKSYFQGHCFPCDAVFWKRETKIRIMATLFDQVADELFTDLAKPAPGVIAWQMPELVLTDRGDDMPNDRVLTPALLDGRLECDLD